MLPFLLQVVHASVDVDVVGFVFSLRFLSDERGTGPQWTGR